MKNWSLAYWQWLIFYYRLTSKCISFLRWWKSPVPGKITQTSRILTYQKIGFSCQHYLQFSVPGGAGMWGLHFLGEDLAVWHTLTSSWWEAKGAAAKASTYFQPDLEDLNKGFTDEGWTKVQRRSGAVSWGRTKVQRSATRPPRTRYSPCTSFFNRRAIWNLFVYITFAKIYLYNISHFLPFYITNGRARQRAPKWSSSKWNLSASCSELQFLHAHV